MKMARKRTLDRLRGVCSIPEYLILEETKNQDYQKFKTTYYGLEVIILEILKATALQIHHHPIFS
jgi:hypothetical protein